MPKRTNSSYEHIIPLKGILSVRLTFTQIHMVYTDTHSIILLTCTCTFEPRVVLFYLRCLICGCVCSVCPALYAACHFCPPPANLSASNFITRNRNCALNTCVRGCKALDKKIKILCRAYSACDHFKRRN